MSVVEKTKEQKIKAYKNVIEYMQKNIDKDGEFYVGQLTPLFNKSEEKIKEKLRILLRGRWFWKDEKGLIHNPKTREEVERHLIENVLNLLITYGDILSGV